MSGSAAIAAAVPAADYVAKAGAGDLYETQSSKLVLQTTRDPKIRMFAQEMVVDHAKTTMTVKAAAKASGMNPPPPALDAAKADMIAELGKATGPARDDVYVHQQRVAHQEALMLHSEYSQGGDKAPLRMAATKAVPIVKHHIAMLNAM